jgi:putative endonuclease
MYYVYVLRSLKDKRLYIGYTSNLRLRYKEHCDGKVDSTKNRRPMKLIYYEVYKNKKDAQNRERYLKGGGRASNDLKKQIKNSLN